jgi:flagellar basal-body rod protein FlgF
LARAVLYLSTERDKESTIMDATILAYTRQRSLFERLDLTANNVANQNTSGFKKELAVYMPTTSKIDGSRNPAPTMLASTDLSEGTYTSTGRSLDVAIKGSGFFEVDTPNGARYTRAGSFHINSEGNLATAQGYTVVGGGGVITFQPDDRNITIKENGAIFAETEEGLIQRGQLDAAIFADPSSLRQTGEGLYVSDEAPEAGVPIADFKIAQGMLETSNVQPVDQINELIKINRAVAETARIISDQHSLMRDAVSRLARVE